MIYLHCIFTHSTSYFTVTVQNHSGVTPNSVVGIIQHYNYLHEENTCLHANASCFFLKNTFMGIFEGYTTLFLSPYNNIMIVLASKMCLNINFIDPCS